MGMIIDNMKVDQKKKTIIAASKMILKNQNHLIRFLGNFKDDIRQRHIKIEYRAKEKGKNIEK